MSENPNQQEMDFCEALFLMRTGSRVRRKSWNDYWLYITMDEELQAFFIKPEKGGMETLSINTAMVFAKDWVEVK